MRRLDFYLDFKNLDLFTKEQISLGVYSLYGNNSGKFLLIMGNSCKCCYGPNAKRSFFIVDKDGVIISEETESIYKSFNPTEVLRFNLPSNITDNYLKIKN